jgi:DNA (cytosine-5)-methyltransferase 1
MKLDIITFGFPCTDLSVAGKRAGLKGSQSGLFYEAIRIVRKLRPAVIVLENVPGLISSNAGHDFRIVLDSLRQCGAMDIAFRTCDSRYFNLAQRRERVFVVADFSGERAGQILFESPCGCGDFATGEETRPRVAATVRSRSSSPGVSAPGRGGEDDQNLVYQETGHEFWSEGLPRCSAHDGKEVQTLVTHTLRSEGADASEDGTGRGVPLVVTQRPIALTCNCGHEFFGELDTPCPACGGFQGGTATYPPERDGPTDAVVYQCHGSNVGPMGTLRKGRGDVQSGVPFLAFDKYNQADTGDVAHAVGAGSQKHNNAHTPLVFMPHRTLQDDGSVAEGFAQRDVSDALHGPTGNKELLVVGYTIHGSDDCRRAASETDVAQSLRCRAPGQVENSSTTVAVGYRTSGNCGVMEQGDRTAALNCATDPNQQIIGRGMSVRRLTPTECLRLQGFSDDWLDLDPVLSDSSKYRLVGNAVSVPVIEWIAHRLKEACPELNTYLSLFAGLGGFDLAFDRTGFQCVGQVELDKHACRVLERHWPGVPRHGDVRTFMRSKRAKAADPVEAGSGRLWLKRGSAGLSEDEGLQHGR